MTVGRFFLVLELTGETSGAFFESTRAASTLSEQIMTRTINEHHRAAKRLFALAEKCRPHTRLRLLQLARLNLMLAKAKLENPALRPDRSTAVK